MITVNGWCAGGMGGGVSKWGDECSVNGGDGLSPNFLLSFLENIDRRSSNDEGRDLIPGQGSVAVAPACTRNTVLMVSHS